jgi:hypothetical protein
VTEAEWLAATDPTPLLEFLRGKASDRKLRLFAVACCRLWWAEMTDDRSRKAVEVAEAFADGKASQRRLAAARSAADYWTGVDPEGHPTRTALVNAAYACAYLRLGQYTGFHHAFSDLRDHWPDDEFFDPRMIQAELTRCVFGNPFRPVTVEPSWLTPTVLSLAEGIYADRAFDRMPVLADALQDAGCDNADVLDHCRGPGPHVRGCWVVDLLLGKE